MKPCALLKLDFLISAGNKSPALVRREGFMKLGAPKELAAVASWLARRYANPKVRGLNPGLDRLRILTEFCNLI